MMLPVLDAISPTAGSATGNDDVLSSAPGTADPPVARRSRWATVVAYADMARFGVQELVLATVIPLVLFACLHRYGTGLAIGVSAAWALAVAAAQTWSRRRLSGLIVLSIITIGIKATAGLATSSTFLYFAVPCGGTMVIGALFALTATRRMPLLLRLANDVVPFLAPQLAAAATRGMMIRLSILWGASYVANGAGTLVMLSMVPLHVFLFAHLLIGWLCTGLAVTGSGLVAWRHGRHVLSALRLPSPGIPDPTVPGRSTLVAVGG